LVKDSAGVRIVESSGPSWEAPWRVDPEPLLTIGSVGGSPDHELDQVIGAVKLTGGLIVVANGGRQELLYYDLAGMLQRRVGGRGEGPGEFLGFEWLSRYREDTILVLDVEGQRISFFDSEGHFGRSVRLEPNAENPAPFPVGFFADGSFLATKGLFQLGGDPPAPRVERRQEPLFLIPSDGRTGTVIGAYPVEAVIVPSGPNRGLERRGRPFGRKTVFAAAADRFYVADNETYEVQVYSITGELTHLIRKQTASIPLDASDIQAYEDSVLAVVSSADRPQMRRIFANLPPSPETYPAYAPEIHVDGDMNLWVRESTRRGDRRALWSVFSSHGHLLGTLEMPPVKVLDIGFDYVIGLWRDDYDVEYVKLFRLNRSR